MQGVDICRDTAAAVFHATALTGITGPGDPGITVPNHPP
jgi:hypothetical protein